MKKIYILLPLMLLTIMPINVSASSGMLKKGSIKTCPDGITYGMHSNHWHKAVTNGDNYYSSGDAIAYDPCPSSNENKGTAGQTSGNTNNSSSNANNNYNSNTPSYSNNNSKNNSSNNSNNNHQTEKSILAKTINNNKSNDNSLKKVTIDGINIKMSENMSYETTKKNIDINITPNSEKATVSFNPIELKTGENIIDINVTAENGDTKKYTLTINKIKGKGNAKITEFILDNNKVDFEDNKATIQKDPDKTVLNFYYKLNNPKAKLVIYHNNKETNILENVKENDIIKLLVIDENDNENTYEIKIENESFLATLIAYYILIVPITSAIILFIIYHKKRKIDKVKTS